MPTTIILSLLAVLAGVSVITQQVFNANLRGSLQSAAWAGVVSYAVGVICMIVFVLAMRDPVPSLSVARSVPWYLWSGGALGALFIAAAIFLVPKLGAAAFVALLVAGQMLASMVYDHFGLFGLEKHAANPVRLLGAALLIAGVVLIRR
jgi:bacterial/archaeal transporter family-2 protein